MTDHSHDSKNLRDHSDDNNNNKLVTILLIFYIIWKMPIVALYMNTYMAMVILVFTLIAVMVNIRSYKIRLGFTIAAGLYFILGFIERSQREVVFFNNLWSCFLEVMPLVVGMMVVQAREYKIIEKVLSALVITYSITAVTTYIGLFTFPEASRIMATSSSDYTKYFSYNIGDFDFIYSLTVLHPLIVCMYKAKRQMVRCVAFTFISAMCVFKSAYTMAALLFIGSCVAYFLPSGVDRIRSKRRMYLVVIAGVIALMFLPSILNALAEWGVLEDSSGKISDIASILQGESASDVDTEARQSAYSDSWEMFLENPILGSSAALETSAGGHSFVLDMMAKWGLIGLVVVISLFKGFLNVYKRILKETSQYYYALLFILITVALAVLNSKPWIFELGFAAPMLMYYAHAQFSEGHH